VLILVFDVYSDCKLLSPQLLFKHEQWGDNTEMTQWYLIQFKPNSHRLAKRNLQRQGFETFLPLHGVARRTKSRFITDLRPLFPGYMFVGIDKSSTPWSKINSTLGVSRLVTFDGTPKPLPSQLISILMRRCDEEGKILPPAALNPGDNVEILIGPFAHFVATVETIDAQQRAWILMDFMGQSTRIQIAPNQIQLND
jgi:transcriptional antiterminator RfaH